MIRTAFATALAAGLAGQGAPAIAAERSYSVTAFDRVRVDGPYRVRLRTGVAPFARAAGSTGGIDALSVHVEGRTLIVRQNRSGWGGYPGQAAGPVELDIGTHDLGAAWLNGAGSLDIDRVKGLSFDIAVQGSGSIAIAQAKVDSLKIAISGAGSARVAGTAPRLTAIVRGTSTLDVADLAVRDATVGVEGPSTVKAAVTGTAEVDARGAASVILAGSPACTVRAAGSAVVEGCAQKAR